MRSSAAVARGATMLGSTAEARTLLAHVLGVDTARLALVDVSDADLVAFDALASRRFAGEPLQHLTGMAYFRGVSVRVGPGVFIPRPETELLAGWALERLRSIPAGSPPVVVELCAGSGALVKSLAAEFPGADYWAVELSDEAWPYLDANLAGTGVRAVHGDMADALAHLDGSVDLVVVNPPYVPDAALDELPTDVLHDPAVALFSGPDGLAALRVVTKVAARLLKPGGWVAAEHDDGHGQSAPALFAAAGYVDVADHRDLAGRPRFVVARSTGAHLAG